jgi:hypothetical protein
MFSDNFRDVVIQPAGKIECVRRLCPITEHYWHRREHLHRDIRAIHLLQPARRIPGIVLDFAKDLPLLDHPGAARLVMLQPDKAGITVFRIQVGPLARQDVRMEIDLHL